MRFFFPDVAGLPLPVGHRFPAEKYLLLKSAVTSGRILGTATLIASPIADDVDLLRAHDPDYIAAMSAGTIAPDAMRRIGLPWSDALIARSRATVGGALAAAREALAHGISGQLAGGTHHAHRSFGSGFCVFNDLAATALSLLDASVVARVAIVDLDVHQGDGTAAILGADPRVFTLSIQGAKNFPFRRVPSTLDVELPDGTGDADYMRAVNEALEPVIAFRPDLVLYLAGVDPLAADALGRLSLTHAGLIVRDRLVFQTFRARGVPVSIAIGGGYARPIDPTVVAYANIFRTAATVYGLAAD